MYIFSARALASCRCCPLSSNVRRQKTTCSASHASWLLHRGPKRIARVAVRHRNTQTAPCFSTTQLRCLSQTTQPSLFHGPPQGGGSRLARSGGGFGRARHCCSALPFREPPSAPARFPHVRRSATVGQCQKQGSVRLCRGRNCRLTLRSSGAPTAWRTGHQALGLRPILRLLSSTPRRRRPLSLHVRHHESSHSAFPAKSTCGLRHA